MHKPHEATVTQGGRTASRLGLTVSETQLGLKQHLPLMSDRELARHDESKRKGSAVTGPATATLSHSTTLQQQALGGCTRD